MEKYWNRLKYGFRESDEGTFPSGDLKWDLTRRYLHTGILEVAQQYYKENHPEIELFVEIILQAGKDLHSIDEEIRADAEGYLESGNFDSDCELLGLNSDVIKMVLINSVKHKDSILTQLEG